MASSLPVFGDFDALNLPKWDREMIETGFQAVSSVEGGWEFLKSYSPPVNQGFMFSPSEGKRKEIDDAIAERYPGHSGATYGCTMRILERIAKDGWEAYAKRVLKEYGPPNPLVKLVEKVAALDSFLSTAPTTNLVEFAEAAQKDPAMRAQMPDIDDQAAALKKFAEGKLSYAEMRMLCG